MTPIETYLQPLEGTVAQVHEKAALAVLQLRDNESFITLFRFMNQISGGALTSPFVDAKGNSVEASDASRSDGSKAFPRFILDTILNNYKP